MNSIKPNVLLIVSDEMRPFELGCYGGKDGNSPSIDRLAARSTVFETACTPNPVCTPARSCLLSGQYTRSCVGTLFNVDEPVRERVAFPAPTIAECFRSAGYHTVLTGKWHVKVNPHTLGFDEAVYPKAHHLNRNQLYYKDGKSFTVPGYVPYFELGQTREFLLRKQEQPFFLYHNISLPHAPAFDVPLRFHERYRGEEVTVRPNVRDGADPEEARRKFLTYMYDYLYYMEDNEKYSALPEDFDNADLLALYKGMIAAADEQVGALMDMLWESGHDKDTIVVFLSDHGDTLGSHGRYFKENTDEETIRVPMMVSWPEHIAPSFNTRDVVSLIDVAPTLLGLAGVPIPPEMQGENLSDVLLKGTPLERDRVFIECTNGEIAVRTPTHMYSVLTAHEREREDLQTIVDDQQRFYDLTVDPYEQDNMAKTGRQPETAAELRESVLEFQRTTPWFRREAPSNRS